MTFIFQCVEEVQEHTFRGRDPRTTLDAFRIHGTYIGWKMEYIRKCHIRNQMHVIAQDVLGGAVPVMSIGRIQSRSTVSQHLGYSRGTDESMGS